MGRESLFLNREFLELLSCSQDVALETRIKAVKSTRVLRTRPCPQRCSTRCSRHRAGIPYLLDRGVGERTGVGVRGQEKSPVSLCGWSWHDAVGKDRVTIDQPKWLAENEPATSDSDGVLVGSSCPV